MKKFAAILIGMSISGAAFAQEPMIKLHCYEQVHHAITGHVMKTYHLFDGMMPIGTLPLKSKADHKHHKKYFLHFSANGQEGGRLDMVMPEQTQSQGCQQQQMQQQQCMQEVIPGTCVEVAPPAQCQEQTQVACQEQTQCQAEVQAPCQSQDQGQAQASCQAQDQGQAQASCQAQDQGQAQASCQAQDQGQAQASCQGQDQGQVLDACQAQAQAACVEATDMAHVKLFSGRVFKPTVIDFKHMHSASLSAGETASLQIEHHRGIAGRRVTAACDVTYLGGY